MVHTKIKKTNAGLAGWRLAYLIVFLSVTVDFLLHEGTHCRTFANKGWESVLILPSAYAVSPDQKAGNLPRYQRSLNAGTSNDYNSRGGDGDGDKRIIFPRTIKSKRRLSIEIIRSAKRSFGDQLVQSSSDFSKIFDRSPLRQFILPKKANQDCLRETTRLVGGANFAVETEENPQQNDSSSSNPPSGFSSDATQGRKSFFGNILPKTQQLFLSKESEETIRKNIQLVLSIVQKTTSQAGPSFLTALSLFGSNGQKNGVSFLTLYMVALLGASCGFHLFLHFITLGYALGVTLPLALALFVYQVSVDCTYAMIVHCSGYIKAKNRFRVYII